MISSILQSPNHFLGEKIDQTECETETEKLPEKPERQLIEYSASDWPIIFGDRLTYIFLMVGILLSVSFTLIYFIMIHL